jgi:hypothetical protein
MHSIQAILNGRATRIGGKLRQFWGRLTRDPACEFTGQLIIMQGKLDEHYARGRSERQRNHGFPERRRALNVVA